MPDAFLWIILGFAFVGLLAIAATGVALVIKAKKFAWPLIVVNGILVIAGWIIIIAFRKYEVVGLPLSMLGALLVSIGLLIRKDRKKQE